MARVHGQITTLWFCCDNWLVLYLFQLVCDAFIICVTIRNAQSIRFQDLQLTVLQNAKFVCLSSGIMPHTFRWIIWMTRWTLLLNLRIYPCVCSFLIVQSFALTNNEQSRASVIQEKYALAVSRMCAVYAAKYCALTFTYLLVSENFNRR
jgi:hypothetical protein